MFTIFRKRVGDIVFDRYYKKWGNAKDALEKEVADMLSVDCKITKRLDRMNHEKGFYEYEVCLKTYLGEDACLALIDGYFID
jgi:hypothetical protein